MKSLSKLVTRIASAVVMVVVAVTAGGAAGTAFAGGSTVYVDNTGHCRNAVPTISQAVTLLAGGPGRIIVCAGTYPEAVLITAAHDITLVGRPGATLVPPSAGYAGALVSIGDSTNITVQSLTFDGTSGLGSGAIGIFMVRTSGKITRNTFTNWNGDTTQQGIVVVSTNPTPVVVTVTSNRFTNWGGKGIALYGRVAATVSGNRLDTIQSGVTGIFASGVTGGRIVNNNLSSTAFTTFMPNTGIDLNGSSSMAITSNRLTHFNSAIVLDVTCASSLLGVDSNTVRGNRIHETGLPINVMVTATSACSIHANNNVITGNQLVNTLDGGVYGIQIATTSSGGVSASADSNTVINNLIQHFGGPQPNISASGTGAALPTGTFGPNTIVP